MNFAIGGGVRNCPSSALRFRGLGKVDCIMAFSLASSLLLNQRILPDGFRCPGSSKVLASQEVPPCPAAIYPSDFPRDERTLPPHQKSPARPLTCRVLRQPSFRGASHRLRRLPQPILVMDSAPAPPREGQSATPVATPRRFAAPRRDRALQQLLPALEPTEAPP
jgi:hypothetical protein